MQRFRIFCLHSVIAYLLTVWTAALPGLAGFQKQTSQQKSDHDEVASSYGPQHPFRFLSKLLKRNWQDFLVDVLYSHPSGNGSSELPAQPCVSQSIPRKVSSKGNTSRILFFLSRNQRSQQLLLFHYAAVIAGSDMQLSAPETDCCNKFFK